MCPVEALDGSPHSLLQLDDVEAVVECLVVDDHLHVEGLVLHNTGHGCNNNTTLTTTLN